MTERKEGGSVLMREDGGEEMWSGDTGGMDDGGRWEEEGGVNG